MTYEEKYRALARAVLRETCEDGNPFENLRDSLRAIQNGQKDPHDHDPGFQYSLKSQYPICP